MWSYRLRRLLRGLAIPGWLAGVWGAIESASTLAWVREVWVALSPKLAAMSEYGAILALLGIGWLAWLVIRNPRTIDLQEFARARGEHGLILKDETITDRVIDGPATVWIGSGTVLKDNGFEGTSFAVISDDQNELYGAIGLQNCTIVRCRFRRIGFVGDAATIATLRKGISGS